MKRRIALVGLMPALQLLASCRSCPEPQVQVADRIRVVVGSSAGTGATCDVLGLGVGAEFIAEIAEQEPGVAPPDGGPWMQVCEGNLFTGPMSVNGEWTFELEEDSSGAELFGGDFVAQRGDCVGALHIRIVPEDYQSPTVDSGFFEVAFSPGPDASCPEACEGRHSATIEILSGEEGAGGSDGGSLGGGGSGPGGSGGQVASSGGSGGTGPSASGGGSASGGASSSGGSGGMPGLDPVLEQRIEAFCQADCANFEEIQPCYSSQGMTHEECLSKCNLGARNTYHALCPDEFLAVLECAEEHPGAQEYSCEGTELVAADESCVPLAVTMRDCVTERQRS